MTDVGNSLYQLQQTDLAIRRKNERLKEISLELANQERVLKAQRAVDDAENHLKPLQKELRGLDLQVQATKQKQKSSEQRLYSGTVSNPKELQDIEQSIAALKRWQNELEDKMLELMLEVDAATETLEDAQRRLNVVLEESESNNKDLLSEKVVLESELESLKTERKTFVEDIEREYLTLYENLSPKMAFRPIATLTDDASCSICGVKQTNVHAQDIRRSGDLLRCANCNRILIAL